jgi:hypothetical protein
MKLYAHIDTISLIKDSLSLGVLAS